jgi:hypothetical protein
VLEQVQQQETATEEVPASDVPAVEQETQAPTSDVPASE